MCSLKVGEWSDYIVREFTSEELGKAEAVFRIKLLELSADGETVTRFCNPTLPNRRLDLSGRLGPRNL